MRPSNARRLTGSQYPGPNRQQRILETVYQSAVRQRPTPPPHRHRNTEKGQSDDQQTPDSYRQEHPSPRVDGKSLTDWLGLHRRELAAGDHDVGQQRLSGETLVPGAVEQRRDMNELRERRMVVQFLADAPDEPTPQMWVHRPCQDLASYSASILHGFEVLHC